MGYEILELQYGAGHLRFEHTDDAMKVSLVNDAGGVVLLFTVSRDSAQKLKQHLKRALPYDHGHD